MGSNSSILHGDNSQLSATAVKPLVPHHRCRAKALKLRDAKNSENYMGLPAKNILEPKMKSTSVLLICALQLILYGCVPAFYTYWAPHAEGGKLNSHGQLAHTSTVEFTFDEVRVSFTGKGTLVGMALYNPKGKSANFISEKAHVYLPEKKEVPFMGHDITTNPEGGDNISPTALLPMRAYVFHINFSDSEITDYRLKMPDIVVNGKRYIIPEIRFTKGQGLGIFG